MSPEQITCFKQLLLAYWGAPEDTQDEDDAFNDLCINIEAALDDEQRADWEAWNLKATPAEIVSGGLERLRLDWLLQDAWTEFQRTRTDW